jgi:hypothetical protein
LSTLARKATQVEGEGNAFDPLALVEHSECAPSQASNAVQLRERGFEPTELVLLFATAGLEVTEMWGGTTGNWVRRAIDLDEIEIMVVARKVAKPLRPPLRRKLQKHCARLGYKRAVGVACSVLIGS